jgi:hypothetical protein
LAKELCAVGLLFLIVILALPWVHALAQRPRAPFIYGALVGGMAGAVVLAWVAGEVDFLSLEFGLARSALAALLVGGPLGSLLGQALVAMCLGPRERQYGAAAGLVLGPILGWPPMVLFPATDPRVWHGPYWIAFWLGSWAGWLSLAGALVGLWSRSWAWGTKRVAVILTAALVLPAVAVGAWHFESILLHVTAVHELETARNVEGLVWKLDHGEEVAEAIGALGRVCEAGMDPPVAARLAAILDGTFAHMPGQMRSDPDYIRARAAAAEVLGRLGDTQSVSILLRYATDPEVTVRYAVIMALAGNRHAEARAAVRRAAEGDPNEQIRAAARKARQQDAGAPTADGHGRRQDAGAPTATAGE